MFGGNLKGAFEGDSGRAQGAFVKRAGEEGDTVGDAAGKLNFGRG